MSSVSVFVGLDYHNASVQVCVLNKRGELLVNRSCANAWRKIVDAVGQAAGGKVQVFAAIEAWTGAADLADELIDRAGWSVHLAHPGYGAQTHC